MKKRGQTKRGTRKHKGGYYGMSGAIAPGAALWTRGSEVGDWAVSSRGANTQYGAGKKGKRRGGMLFCKDRSAPDNDGMCADGTPAMSDTPLGGRKKLTKRRNASKKTRKQRGRGRFGGVSASYQGSGSRGLADHVGIVTRDGSGAPAGGAFNNFGAQPGSGFGSFIKAN